MGKITLNSFHNDTKPLWFNKMGNIKNIKIAHK